MTGADLDAPSYGAQLLQVCLVLAGVCLLAYLVLRFVLPRFYAAGGRVKGPLEIVQRLPLEPRKALYVVAIEGKRFLVGTSDGGAMTIVALPDEAPVD
jgi:flagellar biogenesis protein FliO